MATPRLASVQVFARLIYEDGTSMVLQADPQSPSGDLFDRILEADVDRTTTDILREQGEAIVAAFSQRGTAGTYADRDKRVNHGSIRGD